MENEIWEWVEFNLATPALRSTHLSQAEELRELTEHSISRDLSILVKEKNLSDRIDFKSERRAWAR